MILLLAIASSFKTKAVSRAQASSAHACKQHNCPRGDEASQIFQSVLISASLCLGFLLSRSAPVNALAPERAHVSFARIRPSMAKKAKHAVYKRLTLMVSEYLSLQHRLLFFSLAAAAPASIKDSFVATSGAFW